MKVYVIGLINQDIVKVGIARDEAWRLRNIQTSCPFTLRLFFSKEVPRARAAERYIHKLLKPYRMRGEWFGMKSYDAVRIVKRACDKFRDRSTEHQNEWRKKPNKALSLNECEGNTITYVP